MPKTKAKTSSFCNLVFPTKIATEASIIIVAPSLICSTNKMWPVRFGTDGKPGALVNGNSLK